jgi:hypothetical protein
MLAACTGDGLSEPSDGALTDDAALDGGGPGLGQIFARQEGDRYETYAEFGRLVALTAGGASCPSTVIGACTMHPCPTGGPGLMEPSSAGVVTVSGLLELTLQPDSRDIYPENNGTGVLFDASHSLAITASGAEVPAFSFTTATPRDIVVESPLFGVDGTVQAIPHGAPFTVTWNPVAGTIVDLRLVTTASSVDCHAPSEAGTFTFPAESFAQLSGHGSLSITPDVRSTFSSGGFDVSVDVSGDATQPDGTRAGGAILIFP